MTIYTVCAVRDAAVDIYFTPIFVRSTGEAIRGFLDEVNREGSAFNIHPEDYELFQLGMYDDSDASFSVARPVSLVTGKSVFKAKEK